MRVAVLGLLQGSFLPSFLATAPVTLQAGGSTVTRPKVRRPGRSSSLGLEIKTGRRTGH